MQHAKTVSGVFGAVRDRLLRSSEAADETASPAAAKKPAKKGHRLLASIGDSMKLLMIEHSTRILFQEKTRRELGGPFWEDYRTSVRFPRRWEDSDPWWFNYKDIQASVLRVEELLAQPRPTT